MEMCCAFSYSELAWWGNTRQWQHWNRQLQYKAWAWFRGYSGRKRKNLRVFLWHFALRMWENCAIALTQSKGRCFAWGNQCCYRRSSILEREGCCFLPLGTEKAGTSSIKCWCLLSWLLFSGREEKKRSDIYMYLATITLSASKYQV